jgi:multidrug efflux pump subunit AcrA (membrane-fusion protein)
VIAINPIASVVNNVVTYTVTFALDRTTAGARPGMTATIDVVTAERDNVLNVPSSAIQTGGGSQFATVMQGKNQVRTPVTAGLQGDTTTEITSGLKAGQQVVLQTATVSASTAGTGTTTGGGGFRGGGGFGGLGGLGGG